jgi:hypothetical protein
MDARNGGSGRERDGSVSFPVARCGDFDGKSELEAAYRSGSVPRCGQSNHVIIRLVRFVSKIEIRVVE